jgi:hypothetical protein
VDERERLKDTERVHRDDEAEEPDVEAHKLSYDRQNADRQNADRQNADRQNADRVHDKDEQL